jgi:hypothetical protein
MGRCEKGGCSEGGRCTRPKHGQERKRGALPALGTTNQPPQGWCLALSRYSRRDINGPLEVSAAGTCARAKSLDACAARLRQAQTGTGLGRSAKLAAFRSRLPSRNIAKMEFLANGKTSKTSDAWGGSFSAAMASDSLSAVAPRNMHLSHLGSVWSGDMRLPICSASGTRSNRVKRNCNSPQRGNIGHTGAWVSEVISRGVFRALVGAFPALTPVFQVPPMVASADSNRPNTAHKIWNRENRRQAPKLRLGDKSIGIRVRYLWLHFFYSPTTYC